LFSVIIPLYNKAPFIQRAIDSVQKQTVQDFEVIVINDGSTDGGEKLLHSYLSDRIQLINQVNQGVSAARNKGIKQAKFPYIAFLDADDQWHPLYLESIIRAIETHPQVKVFGTSYTTLELSEVIETEGGTSDLIFKNYFNQAIRNTYFFTSATVYSREIFEKGISFNPNLSLGEDLDVLFRSILVFGEAFYISNPFVLYGQDDESSEVKKQHAIEHTLIFKILDLNDDSVKYPVVQSQWLEFQIFRKKWVLFNLFQFYQNKSNRFGIETTLSKLGTTYFLIRPFYYLPFPILSFLFRSELFSSLFRKYMKFCFRYIYS